jgi:hypothetical protein
MYVHRLLKEAHAAKSTPKECGKTGAKGTQRDSIGGKGKKKKVLGDGQMSITELLGRGK